MEKNKPPTNTKAMIHATSLRLGNLILEAGEIKKVYQLSIGGKTYDSINYQHVNRETGLTESGEDRFMPIQLTAEWLEQMGFIKDEEQPLLPISEMYSLKLNIRGNNNNLISACAVTDQYPHKSEYSNYANVTVNDFWASRNLHFVHQIQNVVHALTGEELVIKTTTV